MNQPQVYRSPLPIVIIIWKDGRSPSNSLFFPELDLGNSESATSNGNRSLKHAHRGVMK